MTPKPKLSTPLKRTIDTLPAMTSNDLLELSVQVLEEIANRADVYSGLVWFDEGQEPPPVDVVNEALTFIRRNDDTWSVLPRQPRVRHARAVIRDAEGDLLRFLSTGGSLVGDEDEDREDAA